VGGLRILAGDWIDIYAGQDRFSEHFESKPRDFRYRNSGARSQQPCASLWLRQDYRASPIAPAPSTRWEPSAKSPIQ
jgi:hypothetical protein